MAFLLGSKRRNAIFYAALIRTNSYNSISSMKQLPAPSTTLSSLNNPQQPSAPSTTLNNPQLPQQPSTPPTTLFSLQYSLFYPNKVYLCRDF